MSRFRAFAEESKQVVQRGRARGESRICSCSRQGCALKEGLAGSRQPRVYSSGIRILRVILGKASHPWAEFGCREESPPHSTPGFGCQALWGTTQSKQGLGIAVELLREGEAHRGRKPWQTRARQSQSTACPGTLGKKQKPKTTTSLLQKHCKVLTNALRHRPSKMPGLILGRHPADTEPQHVTFPRAGGEAGHPPGHPRPALCWQPELWPCPPGRGTACAGAVAPGGLRGTSASCPAPAASPPGHLVCVFVRSTLPAGYVRGEECRATLCHEIRLAFLG